MNGAFYSIKKSHVINNNTQSELQPFIVFTVPSNGNKNLQVSRNWNKQIKCLTQPFTHVRTRQELQFLTCRSKPVSLCFPLIPALTTENDPVMLLKLKHLELSVETSLCLTKNSQLNYIELHCLSLSHLNIRHTP